MSDIQAKTNADPRQGSVEFLYRPRINELLSRATQKPLVVVCAVAGYGKTRAVYDFTKERGIHTAWIQCSEFDNISSRFWENFTHSFSTVNVALAEEIKEIGFPDTEDKLSQYLQTHNRYLSQSPPCAHLYVLDDFHLVNNPQIITFVECLINDWPEGGSVILICRNLPEINIWNLQANGLVQNINEEDLAFTESEVAKYIRQQGVSVNAQTVNRIFRDTNGWVFSVNLIARSLKKSAAYIGYVRSAVKQNIFSLMEAEIWEVISERLQHFLICLSLIEHLSADLIYGLIGGDDRLLAEFKQQSAYIRYDVYSNAYHIHHLFLDFLREKQNTLPNEKRHQTYKAAAIWCTQNDFLVDALNYYEKLGDYESITSIFTGPFSYMPYDLALYSIGIFERAPAEVFDRVEFFAAMHVYVLSCLSRWQEFTASSKYYEQRFLRLPENDIFRNHTLAGIYYFYGAVRMLMSTIDDRYDFDMYYAKAADCLAKAPAEFSKTRNPQLGSWAIPVGTSRKGAPQEYTEAVIRMVNYTSRYIYGVVGWDDLCQGELAFYQGDVQAAESHFREAVTHAREKQQFETINKALFYIMRIAVVQGSHAKADQAIHDIEHMLNEEGYKRRFIMHDITLGWYYYIFRQPEKFPDWLKEDFAPYGHAFYIENFGNQVKARFRYLTKDYPPLLAYIKEMTFRGSILYGRIEMLAMEACVLYQMKDRMNAFAVLRAAYETASPNEITMPFIEFGKDMRTLITSALRSGDCGIPRAWLELINRKAAYYAKNQVLLIAAFEKDNNMRGNIKLAPRETNVLHDLYSGLSQTDIAEKQNISVNTVKKVYKSLGQKLHAGNIADMIRIAVEQKLV